MAARVCVGGAGAGAEPTPPTLTHSAPQPGRSARCLFFCSAPTTPGSPPTPRVSPTITAAPILRGPPTPGSPAQTRRPVPPRPSRRLPGIQWSGGKTRPNVPRGEGRGDPPLPARGPPPLTLLPAFRRRGQRGSGWCSPGRRWRAFISPSRRPLRPLPKSLPGGAAKKRGLRQAGEGWMRKEAVGSPPPHRP